MPQLLILAALGAGAYLGVKWLRRKANEMLQGEDTGSARPQPKAAPHEPREPIPTLIQDPETGIYRVDQNN